VRSPSLTNAWGRIRAKLFDLSQKSERERARLIREDINERIKPQRR